RRSRIDARGGFGAAPGNGARRTREPILNGMTVSAIAPPDHDGARRIAQSIYGEIRRSHDWGRQFPDRPADAVLDRLASLTPREMRRAILNGFGNAKLAGRHEVEVDDIQDGRSARKSRIGF